MKTGFMAITIAGWRTANRAEHGPDIENALLFDELDPDEERDLVALLSVDSDSKDCMSDMGEFSEVVDPTTTEKLSCGAQSEDAARLARRLEERLIGDVALGLVGISPKARDRMIAVLDRRLSGKPEELSVQRAELRQEAGRLAPQNLKVMIGTPEEKRRA